MCVRVRYKLIVIGVISGLVLLFEIIVFKHYATYSKITKKHVKPIQRLSKNIRWKIQNIVFAIKRHYRNQMHDAIVDTLEYLE